MSENETRELMLMARRVFSGPDGERILNLILDTYCGVDQAIVSSDPLALAAMNGARNVGVRIKALVYGEIKAKGDTQSVATKAD